MNDWDALDAAVQAEEDRAPAWVAENEGDTLQGEVVLVKWNAVTNQWGTYSIVIVKDHHTGNHLALHAFGTVLQNRMREDPPSIGDKLSVTYQGKRTNRSGNDYTAYGWVRIGARPAQDPTHPLGRVDQPTTSSPPTQTAPAGDGFSEAPF